MGYLSTKHLGNLFLRRLYAKGKLSVTDMVEYCKENCIPYTTGIQPWYSGGSLEGEEWESFWKDNWHLYNMGLEHLLFGWWFHSWNECPGQQLVPVFETREQEITFLDFEAGHIDWGCSEEELEILDSIKWKFAPTWRKRYKEIPVLDGQIL